MQKPLDPFYLESKQVGTCNGEKLKLHEEFLNNLNKADMHASDHKKNSQKTKQKINYAHQSDTTQHRTRKP